MNNPDVVIGEAAVHLRHIVLRHMTRGAVAAADGARWQLAGCTKILLTIGSLISSCRLLSMASKAFRIIEVNIPNDFIVWIMAGRTRDAAIGLAPATALRQPVWLEANVSGDIVFGRRYIHRRAMARPAIVH
jgi:hypothetical protein